MFDLGAGGYDLLTRQPHWDRQVARLLDHVPDPSAVRRVIDLGTGPGVSAFVLAELLPHAEILGVDLSPPMIRRARAHLALRFRHLTNVRFEVADATALSAPGGHFDLATGHSFLYLVPDRRGVLREIRRVVKPGGTLVLMEPRAGGSLTAAARGGVGEVLQAPWTGGRFALSMVLWRAASRHYGRMSPERVVDLFREAGFADVSTHTTAHGLGLHCVGR